MSSSSSASANGSEKLVNTGKSRVLGEIAELVDQGS